MHLRSKYLLEKLFWHLFLSFLFLTEVEVKMSCRLIRCSVFKFIQIIVWWFKSVMNDLSISTNLWFCSWVTLDQPHTWKLTNHSILKLNHGGNNQLIRYKADLIYYKTFLHYFGHMTVDNNCIFWPELVNGFLL